LAHQEPLRNLYEARAQKHAGGGEARVEKQHQKGKLTARERLEHLLDPATLIEDQSYVTGRSVEFGMAERRYYGDGVISGSGKIAGRQVFLSSQDFTVLGGSLGEMQAERIARAQEKALSTGTPFIALNDSGGARIQEGVLSLEGYARIFRNNTLSSGVIPQFSVILGPCAGGAVYSPAITDFICVVDDVSNMYITGPEVIKTVTGEEISQTELGGAAAHAGTSGVAHFRFASEDECLAFLRRLLGYLPSNNTELPPLGPVDDPPDRETPGILSVLPEDEKAAYDVRQIIEEVVDQGSFIEVQAEYARNAVVGFARLAGRTVGLFANQPEVYAAALDINASDKAARFLRFCDAFNIPIVTLVDVPGFMPGVSQEHGGIIRHGAKVLYAIAEATVPKLALIMRKAYGGAYISMASKGLGYDRVMAFPTARVAVMGPEGAASIIFRRDIEQSEDPEAARRERVEEFERSVATPFNAARFGYIDDVIDPVYTRSELVRSLEMHMGKREDRPRKKHGNIPL
jgi:acetyl-CoA carboxylase carboxyltransferase component